MRTMMLALGLLLPLCAGAQTLPLNLEIELGYRWTDIAGNQDLYRTQINEQDGFVLRSLNLSTTGDGTDFFRLDASDLGTSPAGTLRLDSGREEAYRVRLGYRSFDSFRVFPSFAVQHTFDRNRTMFDADLEILTFSKITPFIGYSWGRNEGPGTTTYTLGGDEFRLGSDLEERDRELRLGASFNTGKLHGTFTQGWRNLSTKENLSLLDGSGNNSGPVLGKPINAGALTRFSKTDVEAPFTNLYVVADVIPRTKLIGTYVSTVADAHSSDLESATGAFISFGAGRFFTGFDETVGSKVTNDTWRGGLRAEVALTDTVTFLAGYENESRDVGGTALIQTLLRDTVTFGGISTGTLQEIINADSALNRKEETLSGGFTARAVGPFSFRGEIRRSRLEYGVHPDVSEIVIPGNQGSTHERDITTYELGATYAKSLFMIGATWRVDDGSHTILRTDFADRDRVRVRATLRTPNNLLRLGVTGERGAQANARDDLGFDAGFRLYTGDVELAPATYVRFRGSYSRIAADSRITTRRPETFRPDVSLHSEKGEAVEGGLALLFDPLTVDASISRFSNEGTLPFDFERYKVRVTYDFVSRAGIAAEWSADEYRESPAFGQYDASRYGVFLRLRP